MKTRYRVVAVLCVIVIIYAGIFSQFIFFRMPGGGSGYICFIGGEKRYILLAQERRGKYIALYTPKVNIPYAFVLEGYKVRYQKGRK